MLNLVFLIPVQLYDDGTLMVKNLKNLKMMLHCIKDRYKICLIIQTYREKRVLDLEELGISILYDNSSQREDCFDYTSRFQLSYHRWAGRRTLFREGMTDTPLPEYDCLIAWDGCSPWCLATALTSIGAKRRILWLHDDPNLYLMRMDRNFFVSLCHRFDALISSDERIQQKLLTVVPEKMASFVSFVITLPVDSTWYWNQSEGVLEIAFQKNETNLLAVSHMSKISMLEQLPAWISAHLEQKLALHIYLTGDGPRMNRYLQQVAIYDVDNQFTLLGDVKNIFSLVRACDGLIVCNEDRNMDVEVAAGVFGVPVISIDELVSNELLIPEQRKIAGFENDIWPDMDRFIQIIERK